MMTDFTRPEINLPWTARHGLFAAALPASASIVLADLAGLDASSLAALSIFAVVVAVCHLRLEGFHPPDRFGAANTVTLFRAAGAAAICSVALAGHTDPAGSLAWSLAAAAAVLLALDGVDGWLARGANLESRFGARFDMEVDAFTGLALALLAWQLGKTGPWVLGLGLMRYGFLLIGWVAPAYAAPLPSSFRRKAVCVVQLGVLALLIAPPVVPPFSSGLAAGALCLLALSFARDLRWLARR